MKTSQSNQKKWFTLVGTVMAQFALGSVYTWSLFNSPIAEKLDEPISQVAFSFGILSLALAFASSISGKLQDRFGVRKVTIGAGLLLGASLLLSAHATNLAMIYICAGLLVGFADGTGYLMTLSNCVKFFPKNKGLASACAIGAYGLGSLGFKYINMYLLNHFNLEQAFQYWGIIAMVIVIIGGLLMADAPKKMITSNVSTPLKEAAMAGEFTLAETIKTSQFWMLATIFLTICMSGLYVIGVAKDIGENYIHLSVASAASSVAVIAVANLGGRLVLGVLSDKIDRMKVIGLAILIAFIGVAALVFGAPNNTTFYFSVACIAFSFGGTITVYPSLISDFFGLDNLTKNYGVIYLGFGIGSIAGSIVASIFGGFIPTFYMIMTLLVISLLLTLIIKKPGYQAPEIANLQVAMQ
ncbi:L-lactate MFS transporter [Psychromonas sp. PT13]|uniref:L-lactate MFS transporter n=1 Tax=Psychromonas sp. PT13 TaxID=3439547 RepID=UPI003EBC50F6